MERIDSVKFKITHLASSNEESAVRSNENQTPFATLKLASLIESINKNQDEQVMSISQFRRALAEVGIKLSVFTDPESLMFNLMQILQNPQGLYEVKTVILSAIVLNKCALPKKTQALFNLYSKNPKEMTDAEIKIMLEEIINISANLLPMIAKQANEEPNRTRLPEDKVSEYVSSMMQNKQKFIDQALPLLLKGSDTVSREEFTERIEEHAVLEAMAWSYQLRMYLLE